MADSFGEKPPRAAHWESFWREAEDDAQAMGGEAKREALRRLWGRFLDEREFSAGDLILDIASGAAPIARVAEEVSPAFAATFVCVDYAHSALTTARRLCAANLLLAAADAARLPFAPRKFSAVVSQFGLEYAGATAFAEAARMLGPSGAFAAIVHFRDGGLEAECAGNARLLAAFDAAGLIEAARRALAASYEKRGPGSPIGAVDEAAEKTLREAAEAANRLLAGSPLSAARDLLIRYFNDLGQLSRRRFAYAREEAMGWLDAVERRLDDYGKRMRAMIAAARSPEDIEQIRKVMTAEGAADFRSAPVSFAENAAPGAWWIEARRAP